MADKEKPALGIILGRMKGGGDKPPPDDEPDGDEGDGPSEEYKQAYREYEEDPSEDTFWRAVKACMKGGY